MKAYNDYSDRRLKGGCAYCDQPATTRDHVPAKAFLNKPYPTNLHVVDACEECNNTLSKDEAYVAYLINYINNIQSGPNDICEETNSVHSNAVEERIENSVEIDDDGKPVINLETDRIKNVVIKFATAHMQYELGEKRYLAPTHVSFVFANEITESQIDAFNRPISEELYPEIGSRWMQRVVESGDGWVVIQPNKYRYYIHSGQSDSIRIVIGEQLYCEVIWDII